MAGTVHKCTVFWRHTRQNVGETILELVTWQTSAHELCDANLCVQQPLHKQQHITCQSSEPAKVSECVEFNVPLDT